MLFLNSSNCNFVHVLLRFLSEIPPIWITNVFIAPFFKVASLPIMGTFMNHRVTWFAYGAKGRKTREIKDRAWPTLNNHSRRLDGVSYSLFVRFHLLKMGITRYKPNLGSLCRISPHTWSYSTSSPLRKIWTCIRAFFNASLIIATMVFVWEAMHWSISRNIPTSSL